MVALMRGLMVLRGDDCVKIGVWSGHGRSVGRESSAGVGVVHPNSTSLYRDPFDERNDTSQQPSDLSNPFTLSPTALHVIPLPPPLPPSPPSSLIPFLLPGFPRPNFNLRQFPRFEIHRNPQNHRRSLPRAEFEAQREGGRGVGVWEVNVFAFRGAGGRG